MISGRDKFCPFSPLFDHPIFQKSPGGQVRPGMKWELDRVQWRHRPSDVINWKRRHFCASHSAARDTVVSVE